MNVGGVVLIFCLVLAVSWLAVEARGRNSGSSFVSDNALWEGPGPRNGELLARIKEYQRNGNLTGDICKVMNNQTYYIALVVPGYLPPGVNCSYVSINCTDLCGGTAYFQHELYNGNTSYRDYAVEEHFTSLYLKERYIYHYVIYLNEKFAMIYAWNKNSYAANRYVGDVINIKVQKGFKLNWSDYNKIDAICESILGYKCTSKMTDYTKNCVDW